MAEVSIQPTEKLAYRIPHAAALLDMPERTFRARIADGMVRVIRLKGVVLIAHHELERLVGLPGNSSGASSEGPTAPS